MRKVDRLLEKRRKELRNSQNCIIPGIFLDISEYSELFSTVEEDIENDDQSDIFDSDSDASDEESDMEDEEPNTKVFL